MISFTPNDEQQMLIDTIRRYAVNDVRPAAHEADETGAFPADVLQTGWELGILPGNIPEDLGGFADEYSAVTAALAYEELAFGDLALALHLMAPALVALPIMLSGTPEQQADLLPLFLDEMPPNFTAAWIEPRINFDPADLHTTASGAPDTLRLNGAKTYVPLAAEAEKMLVFARTEHSNCLDGYLIDPQQDGVTIGERQKLMGINALPLYPVTLENVAISAANRLGGAEADDYQRWLNHSRVAVGALAVGVMRAAIEYAIDYAKERVQFGQPIATKQAIAFMLAENATDVDAARLMVWEAAWRLDQGLDATKEAILARRTASQAAVTVTDSAVQTLGGYGYIREYPVERWLRHARGLATFDGLAMG